MTANPTTPAAGLVERFSDGVRQLLESADTGNRGGQVPDELIEPLVQDIATLLDEITRLQAAQGPQAEALERAAKIIYAMFEGVSEDRAEEVFAWADGKHTDPAVQVFYKDTVEEMRAIARAVSAALSASAAPGVDALREALEPFAKVADAFDYWSGYAMPDFSYPIATVDAKFALEDCPNAIGELTENDFQRARAALTNTARQDR